MALFNEANTVRDFIRDLVKSIDVPFMPGQRPIQTARRRARLAEQPPLARAP